ESAPRHGAFVAACAKAGFSPDISVEATPPLAALGLVAAGLGVTMIQQSLRHQVPEGVVLRELPWFSYRTPLWAAWHKVNLR
ncbi:LysR substrate-binding domain-containing protein, partial [Frankia sp. Mgl5]|nr:LysR substrate-binding domain-containing protein [Frankia sp. Mgl5]